MTPLPMSQIDIQESKAIATYNLHVTLSWFYQHTSRI